MRPTFNKTLEKEKGEKNNKWGEKMDAFLCAESEGNREREREMRASYDGETAIKTRALTDYL